MTITLNEIDAGIIQGALDSLGCALADHDHVFTEGERAIFERASELLGTKSNMQFVTRDDDEEL